MDFSLLINLIKKELSSFKKFSMPPILCAITGTPLERASRTTLGVPSLKLGRIRRSMVLRLQVLAVERQWSIAKLG